MKTSYNPSGGGDRGGESKGTNESWENAHARGCAFISFAKSLRLCYTPRGRKRDSVAQWIERFPAEEEVGRSSRPGVATLFKYSATGRWQSPVECTALEMRQGVKTLVGSNPTLPATKTLAPAGVFLLPAFQPLTPNL